MVRWENLPAEDYLRPLTATGSSSSGRDGLAMSRLAPGTAEPVTEGRGHSPLGQSEAPQRGPTRLIPAGLPPSSAP